ncbi:MAG: ATP-binding cassette domain-containing protein, partial [Pseudobutyrivibrio sp.]
MLEIKNLTYKVDDENDSVKEIIDGLDLTVEDGKFIVITGPNGGGKSTLAKLIMGVNQLTSGQIILDGVDISDKNITERAK